MNKIYEEYRKVEFAGDYDVIVVGGGISGVAAAVAAAREGMKTLIIEKTLCLGGLATLGHVVKYLPLDDGNGRQVVGGISEELLKKSILYGYNNLSPEWREKIGITDKRDFEPLDYPQRRNIEEKRLTTFFNIPAFVFALDEMMEEEGIDVLYDMIFCDTIMDNNTCKGIIVESKSGRTFYTAKMIVDASGDADVLFRAGAACFERDNFITYMCLDIDFKRMEDALEHQDMFQAFPIWCMLGYDPTDNTGQSSQKYYGTSVEGVNDFTKACRKLGFSYLKKNLRPDYTMISVPAINAFRTTRRVAGVYELQADDVHKHFEDSIGCTGDWRKAGPVFEIPYRTLIDTKVTNVIAAGRIIASAGDACEVTRAIPPVAMTGQAAGTAAAHAIKSNTSLQQINIPELQNTLEKTGVVIHE